MSNLRYWLQGDRVQNFGDYLSQFLMQELFYDIRVRDDDVRIIGSAIDDGFVPERSPLAGLAADGAVPTSRGVTFWGCGIRRRGGLSVEQRSDAEILAVRGPLSVDELRLGSDIPQGDPGLLLPALYTPRVRQEYVGRTICVPHFNDSRTDDEIGRETKADLVLRPNLKSGMEFLYRFMDALLSADFVLAGSMHAAITAAAYDRPFAYWDSGNIDVPIKWEDFSSSVGIPCAFVPDVPAGRAFYDASVKGRLAVPSMLPLLAHTPYPLRPYGLLKVLRYEMHRRDDRAIKDSLATFADLLDAHRFEIDQPFLQIGDLLDKLRRTIETEKADAARLLTTCQEQAKWHDEAATAAERSRAFHEMRGLEVARERDAVRAEEARLAQALAARQDELRDALRGLASAEAKAAAHADARAAFLVDAERGAREQAALQAELEQARRALAVAEAAAAAHAGERDAAEQRAMAAEREHAERSRAAQAELRELQASLDLERSRVAEWTTTAMEIREVRPDIEGLRRGLRRQFDGCRALEQKLRQAHEETQGLHREAARLADELRQLRSEHGLAQRIGRNLVRAEVGRTLSLAVTAGSGQQTIAPKGASPTRAQPSRRAKQAIDAGDAARDAKNYKEAARHYQTALDMDPGLAWVRVQYGHMLKESSDLQGGENAYRHALRQMPGDADLHRQLGHVRKLSGNLPGALDAYTRAFELDPLLEDLQREIMGATSALQVSQLDGEGSTLWREAMEAADRHDWPHAVERLGDLLERHPQMSVAWLEYGSVLKECGLGVEAVRAARIAVELSPTLSEAWSRLGRLSRGIGDIAGASLAYRRAASLQPASESIRTELAELDGLDDVWIAQRDDGSTVSTHNHRPAHDDDDVIFPRYRGYWLPQKLRDLLINRHGPDVLPLYTHLMGVVDAFAEQPASFRASEDAPLLVERIRGAALALDSTEVCASIIITAFNNLVYTLTCIASILEHGATLPFEIIVGDNQSTDGTFDLFASIGGCVRVVRHPTNLGFLLNCNTTARSARGDYVIMLNNDTLVLPGWLDALVDTFETHPKAGYVGSKLINGDGSLQEAGGIVWRDGSAWNFGRNQNPLRPEFNYVKEVDYVSGASIAIKRALWNDLDGFDPIYAPVYCEDSDLAFRIRAAGYQTLYQPYSSLIHHEGRSHGRDVRIGPKAYQVSNTKKLVERWKATLQRDHFKNGEHVFVARDRTRYRPHILFIDHYIPQWDRDAGSRTIYHYLKLFRERGFQVSLWPHNLNEDTEYLRPLQALGIEVLYSHAYRNRFPEWYNANRDWIDYSFACRPHIAPKYLDTMSSTRTKILYYGHDLHHRRLMREYELTRNPKFLETAEIEKTRELLAWSKSQVILYPSVEEAQEVRSMVSKSKDVAAIPMNIFDDAEFDAAAAKLDGPDDADLHALMFIGGFAHRPNVDAVTWFVTEVMPLVRRRNPEIHLRIAGSHAPPSVEALAGEGVTVLGRVTDEDLHELYRTSALAVVPLRYGAGVKGKVIEAFLKGTPVVSTSVGVQGIGHPDTIAYVADEPADFAKHILSAIAGRKQALERAKKAVAFLRREYSQRSAIEALAPYVPELRVMPEAPPLEQLPAQPQDAALAESRLP